MPAPWSPMVAPPLPTPDQDDTEHVEAPKWVAANGWD